MLVAARGQLEAALQRARKRGLPLIVSSFPAAPELAKHEALAGPQEWLQALAMEVGCLEPVLAPTSLLWEK